MENLVGPRLYSCCKCRNHVSRHDDIISKDFQVNSLFISSSPNFDTAPFQYLCLNSSNLSGMRFKVCLVQAIWMDKVECRPVCLGGFFLFFSILGLYLEVEETVTFTIFLVYNNQKKMHQEKAAYLSFMLSFL